MKCEVGLENWILKVSDLEQCGDMVEISISWVHPRGAKSDLPGGQKLCYSSAAVQYSTENWS